MTDANKPEEGNSKNTSKMPLILGILSCLIGSAGGYFAARSGLILPLESAVADIGPKHELEDLADVTFVKVDPIIVTLRQGSSNKHLIFRSQLEVPLTYRADVEHLLPRIIDIMNSYLSALGTEDFESPTIIVRIRSQLLRRVQVVTGFDRVNDLLVMEFVLN
jgi:flagellar FliL protein